MKTMAEAGAKFSITNEAGEEDYHIELPEGNSLLIVVGTEYGSPASKFDSDRILKTNRTIHEFKHYANGRKWWTQKPGIDFWFAIPKDKIFMVEEKGYSYVPVEIGGERYHLNVSGGTYNGWTDVVNHGCSIGITKSKKKMDALAKNAEHPSCVEMIDPSSKLMSEMEQKEYRELCAYHDTRSKLQVGDKIVLNSHYNVEGSRGPFDIVSKAPRKRSFICASTSFYGPNFKASYKHIDWTKTAEVNAVALV